MIKAVIYDMDDLMVNSDPLHVKAWDIILKKRDHQFRELPKDTRSHFIGRRVVDGLKEIIEFFKLKEKADSLYEERKKILIELVKNKLQTMPGLYESLELLKKHQYRLALASSGARDYINLVLQKFNLVNFFEAIVSGDDVNKGKPDPEIYIVTTKKLKLLPAECLVLEDATMGIKAAKSAGCFCFAIKNLNTPPQDLSQADKVLGSLNEITVEMLKTL